MNPRLEVILSVIVYSVTSGTMLLLNKLAVHALPYPSLVSSIQLAACLALIYGAKALGLLEVDKIEWKNVVPYCAFVTTFCLGILWYVVFVHRRTRQSTSTDMFVPSSFACPSPKPSSS